MKNPHTIEKIDYKSTFFIVTSSLALVAYATQVILSGWLSLPAAIIDGILVGLMLTLVIRLFRRSEYSFRVHLIRYFLLFSAITGFFSLLLWGGVFLSNTFPGALSKVTLTNGEKTIVYYQMSHIASEKYYDGIHTELLEYAKNGYQFYLEGVLPGTPENQLRLEQALGMKMSSGTYESIAKIMGMASQDESLYDGIPRESLIHADISVDDIVASLSKNSVKNANPIDVTKELQGLLNSSSPGAIAYILRGFLNISIRYSISSDGLLDMLDKDTVDALLGKRNTVVVDTYLQKNTEKSVMLYGALHFEGIYATLRSKDARWKIVTYEPLYPYVK